LLLAKNWDHQLVLNFIILASFLMVFQVGRRTWIQMIYFSSIEIEIAERCFPFCH